MPPNTPCIECHLRAVSAAGLVLCAIMIYTLNWNLRFTGNTRVVPLRPLWSTIQPSSKVTNLGMYDRSRKNCSSNHSRIDTELALPKIRASFGDQTHLISNTSTGGSTEGGICTREVYTPNWQAVLDNVLYVYSAHLDPRQGTSLVKVFGAMHRDHLGDAVECQLWSRGRPGAIVTSKVIRPLRQTHVLFPAVDVECTFSGDPWSLSDDVHISLNMTNSTSALKVEQNFKMQTNTTFTVCLWSPLYTADTKWLVEWFETNLVFGAEQFYVYILNVTEGVKTVLNHYQSLGIVHVLPWHEPVFDGFLLANNCTDKSRTNHVHFQMSLVGDCQQRTINKTQYLVGLDLDELIVPRGNTSTWREMVQTSGCSIDSTFVARHMLFQFNSNSRMDPECVKLNPCSGAECNTAAMQRDAHFLRTMCTTERSSIVLPFPERTKYITSPAFCDRLSIHSPGRRCGSNICVMNVTTGALHHYRVQAVEYVTVKNQTVFDNYMHQFWAQITKRVNIVIEALG